MFTIPRRRLPLWILVLILLTPSSLWNQTPAQSTSPPSAPPEETIEPTKFTETLKQIWSVLKGEMTTYIANVEKRNEFETSKEFERRVIDTKQQYLSMVIKFSRDQKLDQRIFGVLFKASLENYDADKQVYMISSPTVVEAPYNIPMVQCVIPNNPYVALADSIRSGYRTSSIYLKFKPKFQWKVAREVAQAAKGNAENVFFKVRFKVSIEYPDVKQPAMLGILPREILLINNKTNQVFWSQRIQ